MQLDTNVAVDAYAAILNAILDVQEELDARVADRHVARGSELEAILVVVVFDADTAIASGKRYGLHALKIDDGGLTEGRRRGHGLDGNIQGMDAIDSGRARHLESLAAGAHQPGSTKPYSCLRLLAIRFGKLGLVDQKRPSLR